MGNGGGRMGIGAVLGLAIKGVGLISKRRAQRRANSVSNAAAVETKRLREEGRAVSNATETNRNAVSRRAAAKEARLRRARIVNSSANSGTTGSSGEIGATSAINASFGAAVAQQQADILAAKGLTNINDNIANIQGDAQNKINSIESKFNQFSGFLNLASAGVEVADDEGLFGG